ncbi:histamine N-methyltransferase-like [Montipora foliosa]|uniref:histamine N-methyltransferase-like n=1 Tax=Montipora foliosa TaxID=591990 RepID=UPI0035F202C8
MTDAKLVGRSLISCPEAYSKALLSFIASLEPLNITWKCVEEHVLPLVTDILHHHSPPFCILSVGSGEGFNDLPFIGKLGEVYRDKAEKLHLFVRAIEPDKTKLEAFRAKGECLPENLKQMVVLEFAWFPMSFQGYVEQKKGKSVKFDVIHFLHSIYCVDVESALRHCYECELGEKGIIFSFTQDKNSPYVRYGKALSSEGVILSPGSYYSNKEVTDVAKRYGWNYVECPGEGTNGDLSAIFDPLSENGSLLLDFLTQRINTRRTVSKEKLQKILNFWESECTEIDNGRMMISFQTRTVMILKGI